MDKPSAVVDKSFLQEAHQPGFVDLWTALDSQYLLLFPFVLVEEVFSNIAKPDAESGVIHSMVSLISERRDLILEESFETVFRELITGLDEPNPRNPPKWILDRIFSVRRDSPEFLEWINERKYGKRESAKQWASLQKSMFKDRVGEVLSVASEMQYVEWLRALFDNILHRPEHLDIFLQAVIASPFIQRYPDQSATIIGALKNFGPGTFQHYPTTAQFLLTRLIYVTVPRVRVAGRKLMSGQRWGDQVNNFEDEQYICSAMRYKYLMTRDEGMKNVMCITKLAGFFKGDILYWSADSPFALNTMKTL